MDAKNNEKYKIELYVGTVFIKASHIPVGIDDKYQMVVRFNDKANVKDAEKTVNKMIDYLWKEGWLESGGGYRVELQTPSLT